MSLGEPGPGGRTLGRYELGRTLGRGAQGAVFEAVMKGPRGLRRPVALKVLRGSGEGLRREAMLSGLLRHRHIVDVYEVGEQDGVWFFSMELCRGGSLEQRRPLPARAVVEVGRQVCRALAYAHRELGLVHLDLKPGNLLLSGSTVKLADLGIARAKGFTWEGGVAGTPRYMAPEQVRRRPVDARTDLYALGLVLADLWTPPDPGAADTFTMGDAVDGGGVDRELPDWLARVVERCTAPAPDDRYASAAELLEVLDALEPDGPGLAELVGPDAGAEPRPESVPVGAARRLAAIEAAWTEARVVTLKGPGGIGKTRLARETIEDGAGVLVDLSHVDDRAGVLLSVARALGVELGTTPVEQLASALRSRGRWILVLDTVEHLTDTVRELVEAWSRAAPELRVLLTSRATTGLGCRVEVERLSVEEGVALLHDRMSERGVEDADEHVLAELVERLDGLPLALELAAGRMGVLSAADVLERLALPLLRSVDEGRNATLAATLDWSWSLLHDAARDALARLSVFRGGFTLEAVERVVGCHLDDLVALMDLSLLTHTDARLVLSRSVREYAAAHRHDPAVEARHAAYFSDLVPRTLTSLRVPHEALADLAAAAAWAVEHRDVPRALVLARALVAVYRARGPLSGGIPIVASLRPLPMDDAQAAYVAWLGARVADPRDRPTVVAEAVAQAVASGATEVESAARMLLAEQLLDRGDHQGAEREILRSVAIARRSGDPEEIALLEGTVGLVLTRSGRLDEARVPLEEALALCVEQGPVLDQVRSVILNNLGLVAQTAMDGARARALYEETARVARRSGSLRTEAIAWSNIAGIALDQRRFEDAHRALARSLDLHRRLGLERTLPQLLDLLGSAYLEEGRLAEAAETLGRALDLARELSLPLWEGTVLRSLAKLADVRGLAEESAELYGAAVATFDASNDAHWAGWTAAEAAEAELAAGRPERALRWLDRPVEGMDALSLGRIAAARARVLEAVGRGR